MEDKYCRFCGALLPEEALFCAKCGKATAVEDSESAEAAPDYSTFDEEEQSSVADNDVEELDAAADNKEAQDEHDTESESEPNADNEPCQLNRSDEQADQRPEAAHERQSIQRKKWNRKRIITITVIVLIVIAVITGAVMSLRLTTQSNKDQESSAGGGSDCFALSGAPYDGSCDEDSKDNPSAALKYLYSQLNGKTVGDESVQLGGRNTSADDGVPYLFIGSVVENLHYGSGVLWYFGEAIGVNPASYLPPMVSDALSAVGYNESVLSFNGSLDDTGIEKIEDFKKQVPYYRYSVSGYGDIVFGLVAYSVDGGHQFAVNISVYAADDLPDWVSNIKDSGKATQSKSAESSDSSKKSVNNNSTTGDGDFTDLWNSVVGGVDMTKLVGTYCSQDDTCVSIEANPDYIRWNYDTGLPGSISFTEGSSNPLPEGNNRANLGFQYQDYQSARVVPQTKTPISMFAGCQSSAGCGDSQMPVYYVMSGTDLSFFQRDYFSYSIDSNNPPDSSRDYLVIANQNGPTISSDTVYYKR